MEMETIAFSMLASNHNIILTLNGQYVRRFQIEELQDI
jgi:hypothetical protein